MTQAERRSPVSILDFELVCPIGVGREEFTANLWNDVLGDGKVERFDASNLPVDTAAEVKTDLSPLLENWGSDLVEVAAFDRKVELALACGTIGTKRFLKILEGVPPEKRGIVMGVGLDVSPLERVSEAMLRVGNRSPDLANLSRINPLSEGFGRIFNPTDITTLLLAIRFECAAFQQSVLTACSSSSQAIAFGVDAVRHGDAEVVIVGGTDSLLNLPAFSAFTKLGVIQPRPDGRPAICRPLDKRRAGTLLGEGAGLMILGSPAFVEERGLEAQGTVLGFGSTMDGYHITSPDPAGRGMRRAMKTALENATVEPEELDYVNLHGTGTRANDLTELEAVAAVVGSADSPVMVSSTKDRHGHLIAAAGIMEAIVTVTAMSYDIAPRTVNLTSPLEVEGLDLVMSENRSRKLSTCMSNSFAFGGVNTSIVFGGGEG